MMITISNNARRDSAMSLIEINGLNKSYAEKRALFDVSFSVNSGEIVGLIGKNGAGKTTILKSIANLIRYNSGKILYGGKDISSNPSITREFGILIECAFLDYVNAYDNLKILGMAGGKLKPYALREMIDDALKFVGLYEVRAKKTKTFSFGMKQRLGLAQALMNAEGFLMLDEPFIGLDPIGKEIAKSAIVSKAREGNLGVLFSSHDLPDVAEICDRIVMIKNGSCIFDGKVNKLTTYHITLKTPMDDKQVSEISKIKTVKASTNKISFENGSINEVMRFIYSQTLLINQMDSEKNTLINMFTEEV